MSRENVEFVLGAFDVWQGGRLDEFVPLLAEDIAWDISGHPLPDFPDTGSGRDDFLRHLGDYAAGWVDYRTERVEEVDRGDDVISVIHEWARMRGTDMEIERDIATVWTVRDRRLTMFRVYKTLEDALAATV
jgi:ketosteroid isomerase-like protein